MPRCTLVQNGEALTLHCYNGGMRVIPWEDGLSPEQRSLLVGCLLGDGRLECRSRSATARFRVHHAERHKKYLFWKYNLLKPWVDRSPWQTEWTDRRNGMTYVSWFFHTRTTSAFTPWFHLFYPDGTKRVSERIVELIDPMALSVWFMDDGCFQGNCIILNTQSFSFAEHMLMQQFFKRKYGVAPTIQKDRRNLRLYFGISAKERILPVIRPHLLPEFRKAVPVTTDSRDAFSKSEAG